MSSEVQQIINTVRTLSPQARQELAAALEQERLLQPERPTRETIDAICGKYAHVHTSSEEFMARKHEDLELEH